MLNFKFTLMRGPDLQRTTLFLDFKLFNIFENFKTTFGYYLSIFFCVLISFQTNVSMFFVFIPEYRSIGEKIGPKKHSGTSLFLVKNIEKISTYFEDDYV